MMNKKLHLKDIILCSMFTVLMVIGAYIKIPVFAVPFTLQFMFTNLACLILGKKLSVISASLYVLIGILGVPVFAQGGGIGYIFNQNFGFVLGFISGNFFGGIMLEKIKTDGIFKYFISGILNLLCVYITGMIYFFLISTFYLDNISILLSAIPVILFICLPGDIFVLILTCFMARRIKIIANIY